MSAKTDDSLLSAVGYTFEPTVTTYRAQDAALYALAIGASKDALDEGDLQFTYELFAQGFNCFPTWAATFPLKTLEQIASIPNQRLNLMEVLHGEHYLELKEPLPVSGAVTNRARITQVYDKGTGALLLVDIESSDEDGRRLATNRASLFIRGRGSFGGDRGPARKLQLPPREADAVVQQQTWSNQALLFRLASGDYNPLHADGRFAALFGYDRPILHGLCTYGFAARAVLAQFAANDSGRFKSINARFSSHVFPGETLQTEMWRESALHVLFQVRVLERNEIVLSNGEVEFYAQE